MTLRKELTNKLLKLEETQRRAILAIDYSEALRLEIEIGNIKRCLKVIR